MKTTWIPTAILTAAWCVPVWAAAAPKVQFEQMVYDFGKTSLVETVSGTFKFRNAGDSLLKLEPPKTSCGCTVAGLKPDTLLPGESGELAFTLNLGRFRATLEKHISVRSNDPQTPEVTLIIKADYTPLYDLNPAALAPNLAFGVTETEQFAALSRTDGKPLRLLSLAPSKPWITATVEPAAGADASTAHIRIVVQRDGTPRRFNEYIHFYTADQTNIPVTTLYLYGQIMGEVAVSPESLYWSVTDAAPAPAERPEALVLRRVAIRSADGKAIEVKNPRSTIKGITIELVPKEPGKVYELLARLDEVPASTVSGNVSFETSVPSQPRIEVPVIVNVFKP